MFKQIALATVAVVALAGSASALPTFSEGSITIGAFTNTQTNLGSTTSFTFDPSVFGPTNYILSGGANDFSIFSTIPINVNPTTAFDMSNPSSFSFDATAAGFGSFAAGAVTNVTFSSTTPGDGTIHNVLSFFVTGNYTVGSSYSNAGSVISADETFSLTQSVAIASQAALNSISISATFVSPAQLPPSSPEPATLSLFGAALAGLGAIRRRRK